MTARKSFKRHVRERARKTGESYTAALLNVRGRPEEELSMAEQERRSWRNQTVKAGSVLEHVNEATGSSWRAGARFAGGVLEGAWQVRDGDRVAVLKWHDPASDAPYNPDAPAIVEHLRRSGYPTPAWLAWGVTDDGEAWSIQDLVEGEPLPALDVGSASVFVELVDRQRALRLPTESNWNPYIRAHLVEGHRLHRRLAKGGENVQRLLAASVALANRYTDTPMPEDEMVHSDLNVSNLLMRDGRLVAVVDVDGAGRGCAAYDLLSAAVNGVSWRSEPAAVEHLLAHGLETYGSGPIAIVLGCLLIETTAWYQYADPDTIEARAGRHLEWLTQISSRL